MKLTIGEKLKIAVKRSGYTYSDIQKKMGITPNTLMSMFNSKGTMGTWITLLKFLNIDLEIINTEKLRCKEDDYKNEVPKKSKAKTS